MLYLIYMSKQQQVQLFNDKGEPTGSKHRHDIDKEKDLCFSIHLLVFTPSKELVLSQIPEINEYKEVDEGKIKSTATSLLRIEETPQDAARRAMKEELSISEATPLLMGREFHEFPNGMERWLDIYYFVNTENAVTFKSENTNEMLYFNRIDLTEKISQNPDSFTHTFNLIWEKYSNQFPF